MMMTNNTASNQRFDELLQDIWEYLAPSSGREAGADILFVFGGVDLAIPKHAAKIFAAREYKYVVISGSAGPLTKEKFSQSEARTFADIMASDGVPRDQMILEENATNTGQNVEFGIREARRRGINVESAVLVAKPFLMRRAVLTFEKQFPHIITYPCPPPGPPSLYLDRPKPEFAARLAAEVDRLIDYQKLGYIADIDIPKHIVQKAHALKVNGI